MSFTATLSCFTKPMSRRTNKGDKGKMESQYLAIKYHDGTKEICRSDDVEFFTPDTIDKVKPDGKKYINQNTIEWAREADRYEIREYRQEREKWRRTQW